MKNGLIYRFFEYGLSLLIFINIAYAQSVTLLQESFETDGNNTRYFIDGAGDNGQLAFFERRELGSTGVEASGGATDGEWIFGASDLDGMPASRIDGFPDLTKRKGRLRFMGIPVQGFGNLEFIMSTATGEGTQEADNPLFISVRFDGGDWIDIGGFKSASSNSSPKYFTGPRSTVTTKDLDALLSYFVDWSWDIIGNGVVMDVAILIDSNYYEEDYFMDNIRIVGEKGVAFFSAEFSQSEVTEPARGSMPNPLIITLESPAPSGGVEFTVEGTREGMNSVIFPQEIKVAAGQTKISIPTQVIQDGGFTGTETDDFYFKATGYNTAPARLVIENSTPEPTKLVVMEIHNATPGDAAGDLQGDANNDGHRKSSDEQFMEIVNFETYAIDLTGWTLGEELGDRHIFPEGTVLEPNTAVVVFGGGTPQGAFAGAIVQTCSSGGNGLGFDRSSGPDSAFIAAPFGHRLEDNNMPMLAAIRAVTSTLNWENPAYDQGASVHRVEPMREVEFTVHPMIPSANNALFSPGGWPDGSPYFTPENTLSLELSSTSEPESAGAAAVVATIMLDKPAPQGGFEVTIETEGVKVGEDGALIPDEIDLESMTYTLPEGWTSLDFNIGIHDDGVLDGDVNVSIIARGGAYVLPAYSNLEVTDVATNDLNIVINEVMADVDGIGADINLDDKEDDISGDQFIEIVNLSGRPVDFSGWVLSWEDGTVFGTPSHVHTFAEETWVPDKGAIIIFGSITEEAAGNPLFGGAIVQQSLKSDGSRQFNGLALPIGRNTVLSLTNRYGYKVDEISYPADMSQQNQSVTLEPDLTGHPDLHFEVSWTFLSFSPGKKSDDTAFEGNGVVPNP